MLIGFIVIGIIVAMLIKVWESTANQRAEADWRVQADERTAARHRRNAIKNKKEGTVKE